MPLTIPNWAQRLVQILVSVVVSMIALATWTHARGMTEAAAASRTAALEHRLNEHVANRDVHFGRRDAERLARVEEGVMALREGLADLKATLERR